MWFQVDPRSSTPIYQQVVDGVKVAVARAILEPGEKMPSVRELASVMTLNHNTIAKAYQELERERVIEVIRGRGTFVAPRSAPPDRPERVEKMAHQLQHLMIEAHHLQLSEAELEALFQEALITWREMKGGMSRE